MTADSLRFPRRHDRLAVVLGLAAVVAAAWVYLLLGAGIEMDTMDMGGGESMSMAPAWTLGYAALVLIMWFVMMTAMMLPSSAPGIVQLVRTADRRPDATTEIPAAVMFVSGYLTVWAGFSVLATLLQWWLDSLQLLSETMAIRNAVVAGLLVAGIGLFQFTPLKRACLRHCRHSTGRVAPDQRWSAPAIFRRGTRYGVFCLGCCAVPMALLFVGGVMNVVWMVAIALWFLAERATPWGEGIAKLSGAALTALGSIWLAIHLV